MAIAYHNVIDVFAVRFKMILILRISGSSGLPSYLFAWSREYIIPLQPISLDSIENEIPNTSVTIVLEIQEESNGH